MVEFGTSSTFRGWVRVRVLGYGSGVRGRKVKSCDCALALASDLVKAPGAPGDSYTPRTTSDKETHVGKFETASSIVR